MGQVNHFGAWFLEIGDEVPKDVQDRGGRIGDGGSRQLEGGAEDQGGLTDGATDFAATEADPATPFTSPYGEERTQMGALSLI